ncbi:MAG: phosphatase PAP2 family protein [Actinomycetota bacterium]
MLDARGDLRAALAMLATATLFTALVWADPTHPQNLAPIDTWWHDLVVAPGSLGHAIARGLGVLGGDAVSFAVRAVVASWLAVRRRWRDLAIWVGASLVADLLVAGLKGEVGRLRPDGSDLRSFPSGHAKYAGQIGVGVALLVAPVTRHRSALWGAAVGWIALMAWSRTALDVHHLSDTIAGALIGAGIMLGVWGLAYGRVASPAEPGADSPP